jgi:VWFA-related protein
MNANGEAPDRFRNCREEEENPMHPRRAFARAALYGLSIFATSAIGAAAQTPAAQSAAVPPPNAEATAPSTILHANTNLVLVDVVVTDHDKPVHGLERSRFHVFEDGREQTITSFDEHRAPASSAPGTMPPMKRAALPPNTYTNIPDYPEAGAVNVLLLDGLNTPFSDQVNVRLKMIQYLGKIKPGTSLAIFGLSSRLRMIAGFSTDLAALTAALKNPKIAAQQSALIDPDNIVQDVGVTPSAPGPATPSLNGGGPMDAAAAVQEFQAQIAAGLIDQRVRITLDAMQQLARYLSAIPGRKNVIWFSGSFPSWVPPDDSLGLQEFRTAGSHEDEIRETTRMLSDARISIYPIDARGLMTPDAFNAANHPLMNPSPSAQNGPAQAAKLLNETEQRVNEQATMQQIAGDTGGRAFIDTNDFADAVADVVASGSSYYTLGYAPDRKQFDGQFHTFKVRLDDTKYNLAYRRGYFADSPDKPSPHHPGETSPIVAASTHGAPPSTQISFVARVLPASNPLLQGAVLTKGRVGDDAAKLKGPVHRYVIDLVLDLHELVFDTAANGSHVARLQLALVAYDADGTRVNYLEHSFQLTLTPARFAGLMASGVPIRAELDLPEGQGSLRIAIHDLAAHRTGSLEVPMQVQK